MRLIAYHGDKYGREEPWKAERPEDGVLTLPERLGVQEELGEVGPTLLGELHEDVGVGANLKHVDCRRPPLGQCWLESDSIILLQHIQAESAHGVVGLDAVAVRGRGLDTCGQVLNRLDNRVEQERVVADLQEFGRLALDLSVVAVLVNDELVLVAELKKREVGHSLVKC